MTSSRERLLEFLGEIEALLSSDGETHWARWMRSAKARIGSGDISGADYLLQAYGGMGSFNDLVLGQSVSGGQFQWKSDAKEMNTRLDQLREEAYSLAMSFRSAAP